MATFTYKGSSWTYNEVTAEDGRIWMDRNLGATQVATGYNDTAAYGDLFQWGRLDDSHQTPTSGTTATLSSSDAPGHSNFITSTTPWDWRDPKNDNLWQNGLNVPAPAGWRLPTQTEWAALVAAAGITNYTNAASSTLKLCAGGFRNQTTAVLTNQAVQILNWSSTVNGNYARALMCSSTSATTTDTEVRGIGLAVRLIKKEGTLYAKVSGIWKIVSPFVRVSGVWKAIAPFYKVGGVWK